MLKLGTSTYSFWHFLPEKLPIEDVIEKAYEMELDGIEILHVQLQSEETGYLNKIKKMAFQYGMDIYCLAIHNDFVEPNKEKREKQVEHVKRCLKLAYQIGAPAIRLNSGRWKTVKSFKELMERNGIEPPLPGYSDNDAYNWVIDSIKECIPTAEEYGIIMALENHWGLTTRAEGVLRIVNSVDSEWLKVLMDTGNFVFDRYKELEMIAPYTVLVHAKTYYGGSALGPELEIDYEKVFRILRAVDYKGYISIEFEGREDPSTGVLKTINLLRKHIGS